MQFLSSALVATLVVFLFFLPCFGVLRAFWGNSRGKFHADNLYKYFVLSLPLSFLIYGSAAFFAYHASPENTTVLGREIWNLLADDAHKVDSLGIYHRYVVDTIIVKNTSDTTKTYQPTRGGRRFDTAKTVTNMWHSGDTTSTVSLNLTPFARRGKFKLVTAEKHHTDTVGWHFGEKPIVTNFLGEDKNLYNQLGFLTKLYILTLIITFALAHGIRRIMRKAFWDRHKGWRLDSDLEYILSGRDCLIQRRDLIKAAKKKDKVSGKKREYRKLRKPIVLVDILCEIGDHLKIYQGVIKDYGVKDDCLQYIILKYTARGVLISEKSGDPVEIDDDFKLASSEFIINGVGSPISVTLHKNGMTHLINLLSGKTKQQEEDDLKWFPIPGDCIYFKADQIKNINVTYYPYAKELASEPAEQQSDPQTILKENEDKGTWPKHRSAYGEFIPRDETKKGQAEQQAKKGEDAKNVQTS